MRRTYTITEVRRDQVPANQGYGAILSPLMDFINSPNEAWCLEFEDEKQANSFYTGAMKHRRDKGWKLGLVKRGNAVYLVKEDLNPWEVPSITTSTTIDTSR
jgi:hypothetical protein